MKEVKGKGMNERTVIIITMKYVKTVGYKVRSCESNFKLTYNYVYITGL